MFCGFQKKAKRHKKTPNNASDYLEQVDDHYEMLYVTEDNSLRKFIEKKKKIFARGCAYYELTNDMKTDIDSEKEVILMDEVRSQTQTLIIIHGLVYTYHIAPNFRGTKIS